MAINQATREITIDTPLGEDVLLLRSLRGHEAMSRLFTFDLDLVSEEPSIKYDDIVGKVVTIKLNLADGSQRYWNGFVSRFVQAERDENISAYRAMVVPWLWFLDQTTDCRIFQNKAAPDIIKQIFGEYGFNDFSFKLYGSFVSRDYCVQYRESDFNFVSRLMEEEGIFYFFQHENGKHTMVLGNDPSAHEDCPDQPTARYEGTSGGWQDDDVILTWLQEQELRPGVYTATDYNFETPSMNLQSSVSGKEKWEVYDFPGEYTKRADGDQLVRVRLQEQQMPQSVARGTSDCRAFGVGYKFKLTDHYRDDLNQEYVLTALSHSARHNVGYTSGASDSSEPVYENTFECVPATTPIRPMRRTPVPVVQGCQTGMVVGPSGEEIFTDKYGRVKVQFHWDREGKKNENSSCWMRVSYPWAGKGWGGIQIPRIGQEVIVDFIEGDPDRPIITGRTYNAGQMPPWDLPGQKNISGYKSNSTKGGGGYNEISFDDTKGTELINIHAQYDRQKKVEHDERVNVGNDRTEQVIHDEKIKIGNDRTKEVDHDEQVKIGNDRNEVVVRDRTLAVMRDKTETVTRNKTIQIGGNQSENIAGAMSIVIGSTLIEQVLVNYAETVGGAMEVSVGGALVLSAGGLMAENVGAVKTETIGGNKAETVGGNKSLTIAKDYTVNVAGQKNVKILKDVMEEVSGKYRAEVTKEFSIAAKKVELTAEDEIHFKTGSAELILKSNGNITIKGNKISVEGDGDVIITGSKVKCN
jgi:type VI secretion system secreted protein VgrG